MTFSAHECWKKVIQWITIPHADDGRRTAEYLRRAQKLLIYYFHSERIPLYLTVFAKNERADLTHAERSELAKLVKILVDTELGKRHGQGF